MKINICQFNYKTAECKINTQKLHDVLEKSNDEVLNVFGELSLSGSPLYNKNLYLDLYTESHQLCEQLCKTNKSFILGMPNKDENGNCYNSLIFVNKGKVLATASKKHLSRFDLNFSTGNGIESLTFEGKKLAFGFLEDLKSSSLNCGDTEVLILCGNTLFDKDDEGKLISTLSSYAKNLKTQIVYVNRVGAEGCYVFNGSSFVVNEKGEVCKQLDMFEEQESILDMEILKSETIKAPCYEERIYKASVLGLKEYFEKNHIKKAVIGLSGGIDSAVVVVLGVAALGKENVTGILMPSEYSTEHSVSDAEKSAKNLGINYLTIPIKGMFHASLEAMKPVFEGTEPNTAEENLQARARLMIVMAVGNKTGAAMLNTSNKSESAVGYGTLYGDDSGAISAIGDLFKTDVYRLAKWINRNEEIIPFNSIEKAPSAELHYDQKDSDTLPEYDILDKILKDYIENHKSKSELISMGYEQNMVERVLHLFKINEWKRHQEAPAIRLSKTCFTTDFFNPIS